MIVRQKAEHEVLNWQETAEFILERWQLLLHLGKSYVREKHYALSPYVLYGSHLFIVVRKKKNGKTTSSEHLLLAGSRAWSLLPWNCKHDKINKQVCMIILHVQCLSTGHGFFVIAVLQRLKENNPKVHAEFTH